MIGKESSSRFLLFDVTQGLAPNDENSIDLHLGRGVPGARGTRTPHRGPSAPIPASVDLVRGRYRCRCGAGGLKRGLKKLHF